MKKELRKNTIQLLKEMSRERRNEIEKQLLAHLFHSSLWKKAETIGLTMSQPFEWNTRPIIERAWQENKRVAIPCSIVETKQMKFYQINDFKGIKIGYGNIEEPKQSAEFLLHKDALDLLIVPGLLFNQAGYRIGFGGGYYDRFLVDYQHTTLALISEDQLVDNIPINQYDIPVQYIITEHGLFKTSE